MNDCHLGNFVFQDLVLDDVIGRLLCAREREGAALWGGVRLQRYLILPLCTIPFWLISSHKIITMITAYILLQTDLGRREEDVTWYRVFDIITTLITTIIFTTTIIIKTLDGEADLGEREELLSSDFLFMKIDLWESGVKDNRSVEISKSLVS